MEGKCLWFFCAVVVISFARIISAEDTENSELLAQEPLKIEPHIFESKIMEAINKLKIFLKDGDPSIGFPPLDPCFLSYKAYDFHIMDTELKGFFQNTTFADFSRFEAENVEFKLVPFHFQINLFLDQLRISGRYKMQGKILSEFPINGTGKFISDTKNLTASLYLKPTIVNSSLQINDMLVEFKILSQKINYTNELVDTEIHELDENLALYILDQAKAKYTLPLLNMVKSILNHFLLGHTYVEIFKIILALLKIR